jgi:hopanoid biosynthesis associated protein HpnK
MTLSFVYPIYNEIENIPRLLPETARIAAGLVSDYEVILVNDGSRDGSGAAIDGLAAEFPHVRAFHHTRNRGLGAAISTGLAQARKELVLYMDSDFPVSAEEAREALGRFRPDCDLLIGYRVGRAEGVRRELMSWTYNRLIRWTFGLRVRDVNFAFKLIRRSLLQQMRLRSEGSFIDAELLLEARRLGARIREVGLHYHPRVAGLSTAASGRVVLRILGETWRYWRWGQARAPGPAGVIVNADDFGLCAAVNQGVVEAHDRGVVTSASILPTGEAFDQAAALARSRPHLDLGVHLALTQSRPVSLPEAVPSLVDGRGEFAQSWSAFVARYLRRRISKREIELELRAQLERVRQAGLTVSHLDSHQHLHILPGILPLVTGLAAEYRIGALRYPHQTRGQTGPEGLARLRRRAEARALAAGCRLGARGLKSNGLLVTDDFRGFSEAGRWDREALLRTAADLGGGLTEICCHPGADDGIGERFPWGYHWEQELAALTNPEVAQALAAHGLTLTTFRGWLAQGR